MSTAPLVSVICLCHNHEKWVREALESVLAQTYPQIELIIIDDASEDASRDIIEEFLTTHAAHKYLKNDRMLGNCASFNLAFAESSGDFIIDFATDDVMHPEKVERQIRAFTRLPDSVGVVHHDVQAVDENGKHLYYHSDLVFRNTGKEIPNGFIFEDLLRYYLVNSPSMMIRRQVLESLGGYDPTLSYEDFDFWMRSSRQWAYHFLPEKLLTYRRISGSLSDPTKARIHAQSTLRILQKVRLFPLSRKERRAFSYRCLYESKQALFRGDLRLFVVFLFRSIR